MTNKKMRRSKNYVSVILLILTIFISIGYAALSTGLSINGLAFLRVPANVRITGINLIKTENDGRATNSPIYSKDAINITNVLPNLNSKITYEIEITNKVSIPYKITSLESIISSTEYIEYIIEEESEIKIGSLIPGNSETTLKITIKYKDDLEILPNDNTYINEIKFTFDKYDKISPTLTLIKNDNSFSITASDEGETGLSDENIYKYYLSTDENELKNGEWTDYTSENEILIDSEGTYYLWVYPIKDNSENVNDEKVFGEPYMIGEIKLKEYLITYELSGGSASNKDSYNILTDTFTLEEPTRTGYNFVGWTGSNGIEPNKVVTIEKGSTGNKNYTAIWDPIVYTITYNSNGGSEVNEMNYTVETDTFMLPVPTKQDYSFAGWAGSNGNIPSTTVTIEKGTTGDKEYTAEWFITSYSYPYSETEYTFTVPKSGYYKLETWGAQGGSAETISGGYGGYSTGIVYLNSNETLYINVGGQGEDGKEASTYTTKGGHNGGGNGYVGNTPYPVGGGGGATHIAMKSGLLSSLSADKETVLIVAGGGGGVSYNTSSYKTTKVGHGGGTSGVSSTGVGTEATGSASGGTQKAPSSTGKKYGTFGAGATGTASSYPGGGGGYYGGNNDIYSAGGGSGYIGSELLLSYDGLTKAMYCYNCATSSNESTRTYKTGNVSEEPIANNAKSGDGYAKITYIGTNNPDLPEYTYTFSGFERLFKAQEAGYYKLETWGAQGGNANTMSGGYGGYSTGVVYLNTNDTLYVNVGGKGENGQATANYSTKGGYNGGGTGSVNITAYPVGGGGGATHIATLSGILSSLESNKEAILIVAGGGGGVSYYQSEYRTMVIGHGGGFVGNEASGVATDHSASASGGTQTGVGVIGKKVASFGMGANGTASSNPGGGGGYYGGNVDSYSGGGGSGYIANSLLLTYGEITKAMYCYECLTSPDDSTRTYSTTNVNANATSTCAKIGNGYAKITYIGN